jgi:hypothetical protein
MLTRDTLASFLRENPKWTFRSVEAISYRFGGSLMDLQGVFKTHPGVFTIHAGDRGTILVGLSR